MACWSGKEAVGSAMADVWPWAPKTGLRGGKLYYKVLIPKIEIKDREGLWNKADDFAAKFAPANQSGWYWAYRDDEIVFAFEWSNIAVLFAAYCTHQGIRFRTEWPTRST